MKKKSEHYVDNKQFLQAMIEYKKSCVLAESKNELKPPVSNYIGECFLKIANHLSYRPNFINYTFRDDMIYYAFIRRIQKEKKQQTIKRKLILKSGFDVETATNIDDKAYQDAYIEYLAKNMLVTEDDVDKPKEKKVKKKKKAKTLLEFFM